MGQICGDCLSSGPESQSGTRSSLMAHTQGVLSARDSFVAMIWRASQVRKA